MKSKEALYRLIKSLEKEEYQLLKKELQRNKKESNLLILLKLLYQQKVYNREQIKCAVKEAGFASHLQQTENQLYDKTMQVLKAYSKKNSVYQQFISLFQEIEIFYRKKLTNECRLALQKAQKLARSYELYEFELSLFYWDFYLRAYFVYDWNKPDHVPDFESYLSNTRHFEQLVQNILEERQTAHQYSLDFRQLMGNEAPIDYAQKTDSPYPLPRLNFYYHLMQGGICFQLRNWKIAQQHYLKAKHILEHNQLLEVHTDALPNLYVTLMSVYLKQLDYKAFEQLHPQAEVLIMEQLSKQDQVRILPFYQHKVHLYYLFRGKLKKAERLEAALLEIYENLQDASNGHFLSNLAYQIALHFFMKEAYYLAVEWINKAWKHKKGMAHAVRYAVQLLEIMVHYELNSYHLIPSLIDAFYRFVKKQDLLSDYERKIIRYVKKYYFLSINGGEALPHLIKLRAQLQSYSKPEYYYVRVGSYINFYAWIDAKIETESYAKSLQKLERETAKI